MGANALIGMFPHPLYRVCKSSAQNFADSNMYEREIMIQKKREFGNKSDADK